MNEIGKAFRDLASMISSERDARRADIADIRSHLQAMDRRLADGDERTSGFEAAVLESLGTLGDTLDRQSAERTDLEMRVAALEQWRRDQAS